MELIITGGGHGKDTFEIDKFFASKLNKSKPLLYIPIAIDNIKHPYQECLSWVKSTFDNFCVRNYKMITEKDLYSFNKTNPKKFSGIYIGGGNTFYLLEQLKKSGFWNFIKKALAENIPIYGGSAGAAIFSKTIICASKYDKNWVGLKDLRGFNATNHYEITCHYSDKERGLIKELISENKIKNLIALTEKNGLYIDGKEIKLIGKENGFIFKKGIESKINIGEIIPKII